MSEKFHINTRGEPGKCHAENGRCPFGSAEDHYATREGASAAYERSMHGDTIPKLEKAPTRSQVEQVLDAMSRGEDTVPEGVKFTNVETLETISEPSKPLSPVEKLDAAIQSEIAWCDLEKVDALKRIESTRRYVEHVEKNFGVESEAFEFAEDAEILAVRNLRDIQYYRKVLNIDRQRLASPSEISVTSLRETLRETRLKRDLHSLLYFSNDGTPSFRELQEKFARPRFGNETKADYEKYLKEITSDPDDADWVNFNTKLAEKYRIESQLDEIENDRQATMLDSGKEKQKAKIDAEVNENVRLYAEDQDNYVSYNSFSNRVKRLFKPRKNILSNRRGLEVLPFGRKLRDFGEKDDQVAWTKIGDNRWTDGLGNISSDKDRKLPAVIVE